MFPRGTCGACIAFVRGACTARFRVRLAHYFNTMSEPKTKSIYWNGNRTKFEEFWESFEIRAVKKKYDGHLSTTRHPELPEDGEAADLDIYNRKMKKVMKRQLDKHRLAVCELRQYVANATIAPIVASTVVERKWPFGQMWLIVKELQRQYRGDSMLDIIQMQRDIQDIQMASDKEHPDKLFQRMWYIKKKYQHRPDIFPDDNTMAVYLIQGASLLYREAFTNRMHTWKTNNKPLDKAFISDLQDLGNSLYTGMIRTRKSSLSELKLFSFSSIDQRDEWKESACYICHGTDHKAYNCPKQNELDAWRAEQRTSNNNGSGGGNSNRKHGNGSYNNNGKKFSGKCNHCGKKGHKAAQCWKKESNKHLRPNNWKSNTKEISQVKLDQDMKIYELGVLSIEPPCGKYEVTCMQQSFNDDFSLLHDKNIWVFDTGASTHSTGK